MWKINTKFIVHVSVGIEQPWHRVFFKFHLHSFFFFGGGYQVVLPGTERKTTIVEGFLKDEPPRWWPTEARGVPGNADTEPKVSALPRVSRDPLLRSLSAVVGRKIGCGWWIVLFMLR